MSFRLYLYEVITDQKQGPVAGVIQGMLQFLSGVYGLAVRAILASYAHQFLPVSGLGKPVVSVGNITWGGVGKTPFVEWLTRYFLAQGVRPAILTRGYMPRGGREPCSDSDEVLMLRKNFPTVPVETGRDRRSSAQRLLSRQPVDVFILDDGFQQWGLQKDLNIVLIDATNPFGNRFLLPRGPLREPLTSLQRADVFVLTKTDQADGPLSVLTEQLKACNPAAVMVETVHRPVSFSPLGSRPGMALADIKGRRVCLLSGIGDPKSFEKTVGGLGASIQDTQFFEDHHRFSAGDVEAVVRRCQEKGAGIILVTAKDAAKWTPDFEHFESDIQVLVLNMEIEIKKGKEALLARIRALHRG